MRPFKLAILGLLLLILSVAGASCAGVQKAIQTIDDVADVACVVFGTEHPEEFKQLVLSVLPPGAAEKHGFDPAVLCKLREVIAPFLADQQALQNSTAAGLQGPSGD